MSRASFKDRATVTGRVLADRIAWRERGEPVRVFEDPATMARTFTYLFGIGATLLLVTLPLPHAADRDTVGLVATAVAAYGAALGFLALFDRLPLWFYEVSPLLGTILVSLVVYFGGSDAPAAYATYYFWVVLAACYFLRPVVAATHLALASAGYGIALLAIAEPAVPVLKWAVATGSLFVVGILMTALRAQMERMLTELGAAARTDALTGLANRRELEGRFAGELERSTRGGRPLSIIVLDLDWSSSPMPSGERRGPATWSRGWVERSSPCWLRRRTSTRPISSPSGCEPRSERPSLASRRR
jgi:hypothetical protein